MPEVTRDQVELFLEAIVNYCDDGEKEVLCALVAAWEREQERKEAPDAQQG